jgi:hypothetical protein
MSRRTIAELRRFYRSVIASDSALMADKMRAAGRLGKLYELDRKDDDGKAALAALLKSEEPTRDPFA